MRTDVELVFRMRLAERALRLVVDRYGFAEMAQQFNPDDPNQVVPVGSGEIRFFVDAEAEGSRSVARVYVDGAIARVQVERVRELVRRSHRKEFREVEHGIAQQLDVEVDMSGVIDAEGDLLRRAPPRPVLRKRRSAGLGAIGAIGSLRRGAPT